MALTPWVHENRFESGTIIRADSANNKFDSLAAKIEEIILQLNNKVVTLPDTFTGSAQIPEQTPENTYIFINGSGDIALYSIQQFLDDVSSAGTNATLAETYKSQAATYLSQTLDAATVAAGYRDEASGFSTTAQGSAAGAEAAKLAAQTAESNAGTHVTAAAGHVATALGHAQTAEYWAGQAEQLIFNGDVVPTTRTINGKNLSTNIVLNFSDVGAKASSYVPSWNEITAKPTFAAVAMTGAFADLTDAPNLATVATSGNYNDLTNKPTVNTLGAVPTSRTINAKPLTNNITLTASDIGAKASSYTPTWTEISSKPTTATRWPTWTEVTSKPSTFTPSTHSHSIAEVTGLEAALNAKLAANMGVYVDRNDANQTITRQGRVTIINTWSTGNITKTIDMSTFVEDDIVLIRKHRTSGTLTVTVDSGVIHIPDGTNAASQTVGDGVSGTVRLVKSGNDMLF